MSNKPLSMKDLFEVKFKIFENKEETKALIAREERYVCAVTNDILRNSEQTVVLKTS
jgi:nitric oxide synthase-interacting protein